MGYRSDIAIAFAFDRKEHLDEVMAIYRMHPFVQEHDLTKDWTARDWGEGVWGLTYTAEYVKWYESYKDVQGIEHMRTVVTQFADEREGFKYAYRTVRLGEESNDIEQESLGNDGNLEEVLYDRLSLRRELVTDF